MIAAAGLGGGLRGRGPRSEDGWESTGAQEAMPGFMFHGEQVIGGNFSGGGDVIRLRSELLQQSTTVKTPLDETRL